MPRKEFRSDLANATKSGRFPRLSHVRAGEDDGSIAFTHTAPSTQMKIEFQALVSDPSDYPNDHQYFVFSTSENVPPAVASALEAAQPFFTGSSIQDFLETVGDIIDNAVVDQDAQGIGAPGVGHWSIHNDSGSDEEVDWMSSEELSDPVQDDVLLKAKIKSDLNRAKSAGLKVGYLGKLTGSAIISISYRIAKLGISEEAMQAWNVRPTEYLVLLIRHPRRYLDIEQIVYQKGAERNVGVQMHVGLCDSYKPSLASAQQAFGDTSPNDPNVATCATASAALKPLFIGKPLRDLLNERFANMLRYRLDYGFSWTGAELYFNDSQGKFIDPLEPLDAKYYVPDSWGGSTPEPLATDHARVTRDLSWLSFPLLAMQFTLRHVVKCTEFCLVCHCKMDDGFEALKPYVCSKGLCLYQYMALGMGPSLEWEILSQPYVVDMLVSFTYSRAAAARLDDFPTGLGLQVPAGVDGHPAQLTTGSMMLKVEKMIRLRVGDWIIITQKDWHCRVLSTDNWPLIQLSDPVVRGCPSAEEESPATPSVQFVIYDTNFDELAVDEKRRMIAMLLDTLPDVDEMVSFINSGPNGSQKLLRSWQRISSSALDVLRWIVASNRSCILQDDNPEHQVSGMEGYMQFRLAQGAPDKEQRFIEALNSPPAPRKPQHPTIFGWHGSHVSNWHSILREGLHFKEVINGRSYGDGVYMAPHFSTSLTFCGTLSSCITSSPVRWPKSKLNIHKAISLNEIVNKPGSFVCANPYVVQQLDWIQPRYLFVKCGNHALNLDVERKTPSVVYAQDPNYTARGPNGRAVVIPISALSGRRRESYEAATKASATKTKDSPSPQGTKRKRTGTRTKPKPAPQDDNDDAASVTTLLEDLAMLLSEGEADENDATTSPRGKKSAKTSDSESRAQTDFRPGTLQESSLQLLAPPTYATTWATKALQQHLQATLKVQRTEPLHELGWYVDPRLISTVYQWIVEMHSFDAALPLAKDLQKAGLTSLVLEIRFPAQFPMSPPFVRIIRPRMLGFNGGGGGHITAGGAMCMELLTNSGWSPASSIESVLLQVRMAISSTDPKPARLAQVPNHQMSEYSVGEAVHAYVRACEAHGWKVPDDMQKQLFSW